MKGKEKHVDSIDARSPADMEETEHDDTFDHAWQWSSQELGMEGLCSGDAALWHRSVFCPGSTRRGASSSMSFVFMASMSSLRGLKLSLMSIFSSPITCAQFCVSGDVLDIVSGLRLASSQVTMDTGLV